MRLSRTCVSAVALVSLAACASGPGAGNNSTVAPSPDPRVGLKPGRYDAGQAQWNMRLVSNNPSPSPFDTSTNSDLAFYKTYVIQGNYDGYQVWDITTPGHATLKKTYYCPASQSDGSLFRIEVIKVPPAAPQTAAIVSSPRIFDSLAPPPTHSEEQQDIGEAKRQADSARAQGGFVVTLFGMERPLGARFTAPLLDSIV